MTRTMALNAQQKEAYERIVKAKQAREAAEAKAAPKAKQPDAIDRLRAESARAYGDKTATTPNNPKHATKEETTMKATKAKAAPKTAAPTKTKTKKFKATAEKGKPVGHEEIVVALRACDGTPKAIVAMAASTFKVTLDEGKLHGAPNPGVLKMRAANTIRGALTRAGRFTGEVYRTARPTKMKAAPAPKAKTAKAKKAA